MRQFKIKIGYGKAPLVTTVSIGDYRGHIIEIDLFDRQGTDSVAAFPGLSARAVPLAFRSYPSDVIEARAFNGDTPDAQPPAQQRQQPQIAREMAHLQINVGTVNS